MLTVEGLHHVYGAPASAFTAIGDVSFAVEAGEIVTIVGPSGCGKTTLLRCVSGLTAPTAGVVRLLGQDVHGVPEGLALVFQDYSRSLFPWMSVRRNVTFPLVGRTARAHRLERAEESLRAVGLSSVADRYPWQLSGGMQQRVAIARALAYRPSLLLMDEPFASVDAQTRGELEDLLLELRARFDFTALFVTHDIDESVYVGDRVIVLSPSPARVVSDTRVELPRPRDQIGSREHPGFVQLRGEVARLIRGMGGISGPHAKEQTRTNSESELQGTEGMAHMRTPAP
jgi:NitT/TauT family transport system ATP-binding protein